MILLVFCIGIVLIALLNGGAQLYAKFVGNTIIFVLVGREAAFEFHMRLFMTISVVYIDRYVFVIKTPTGIVLLCLSAWYAIGKWILG